MKSENILECPACKQKTPHAFLSERGEYNEIYEVLCISCSGNREIPRRLWLNALVIDWTLPSRAYLTKFPYVEPHTGEIVNSPEDRDRLVKAYGLHAAEHGINEKYEDEFSWSLKRREQEKRERIKNSKERVNREIREIIRASRSR